MTRTLYALLVGIDDYDGRPSESQAASASTAVPAASLKGCLNDIQSIQTALQSRVDQNQFALQLRALTNQQATRRNIMVGFRRHLAKASADDVVLFYFAGHGRLAAAPEPFWPVARNRLLKTLVCYDSNLSESGGNRPGSAQDLADVELEQLIAEVGQKSPQITVVLDCGYAESSVSSSGARVTRGLPLDRRARALESFIVSPQAAQSRESQSMAASPQSNAAVRRPVIFSACSDTESAAEYAVAGKVQGAFSHFLQASLAKSNGGFSNLALFKRSNACLLSSFPTQSAQIRAAHADLEQSFLSGAIAPAAPYFTVSHHPEDGWMVDGGSVHGLTDKGTRLALFPYYTPAEQTAQVAEAIAQTQITEVHPRFSKIDSTGLVAAKATDIFRAVVTSLPMPPMPLLFEGDAAGVNLLRQSLNTAGPNRSPSVLVQIAALTEASAQLRVQATNGSYVIKSIVGDRPQAGSLRGYTAANASAVIKAAEHIARWRTIVALDSSASSQINGTVKLKLYTGEEPNPEDAVEITDAQIRLSYRLQENGDAEGDAGNRSLAWVPERFRIKLQNDSNQTLYCGLFYLNDRFRAASIKPDSQKSIVRLLPGEEMWFADGSALNGSVPDSLWQQGITECRESLKLIACVHEFDPTLLNLAELSYESDRTATGAAEQSSDGGSLNQLLYQVHQRYTDQEPNGEIAPALSAVSVYDDWTANQITFAFVRPQLPVSLSNTANSRVTIGSNVPSAGTQTDASWTVNALSHPALKANAHLATVAQAVSSIASDTAIESTPFLLTPGRASDAGLSVIVLSDVQRTETVTSKRPLIIETDVPLEEGKRLVPFAFNGETYMPVGSGQSQNGQTQIVIEQLPERYDKSTICVFLQQLDVVKEVVAPPAPPVPTTPPAPAETPSVSPPVSEPAASATASTAASTAVPTKRRKTAAMGAAGAIAAVGATGIAAASASAKSAVSKSPASKSAASKADTRQPPSRSPDSTAATTPKKTSAPLSSSTQNTTRANPAMQPPVPSSNQPPEQPNNPPVNPPLNPPAPVNPPIPPAPVNPPAVRPAANVPLNQAAYRPQANPVQPAYPSQNAPVSQPVGQQPYQNPEFDDVYAPAAERRGDSEVSPLLWAWVLVTGVLALIVAIAWIQYFQSWFAPAPEVAPANSEPVLPVTPAEPPTAPESDSET